MDVDHGFVSAANLNTDLGFKSSGFAFSYPYFLILDHSYGYQLDATIVKIVVLLSMDNIDQVMVFLRVNYVVCTNSWLVLHL